MVGSLVAPNFIYSKIQAAERFEIHFDGMSIPVSIKELIDWSNGEDSTNSELASWLNLLGFEDRKGLFEKLSKSQNPEVLFITCIFSLYCPVCNICSEIQAFPANIFS